MSHSEGHFGRKKPNQNNLLVWLHIINVRLLKHGRHIVFLVESWVGIKNWSVHWCLVSSHCVQDWSLSNLGKPEIANTPLPERGLDGFCNHGKSGKCHQTILPHSLDQDPGFSIPIKNLQAFKKVNKWLCRVLSKSLRARAREGCLRAMQDGHSLYVTHPCCLRLNSCLAVGLLFFSFSFHFHFRKLWLSPPALCFCFKCMFRVFPSSCFLVFKRRWAWWDGFVFQRQKAWLDQLVSRTDTGARTAGGGIQE